MSQQPSVEERLAKLEGRVNGLIKLSIYLLFILFLISTAVYFIGFNAPDEMKNGYFAFGMGIVFLISPLSAIMTVATWITLSND